MASGQESSDALTTFNTAVSNATTAVEAETTAGDITAQKANLRSAGLTYISSVEGQFDITFLASQLYSDWKKKDGSAAGIVADQFLTNRPATIPSFAENFEWTAATTGDVLYQTVSDLPVGYYQVGMYAMALSTSIRDTGIQTEATEGDADRSFAFANDMRTGMPIKFATAVDFSDLTILDVLKENDFRTEVGPGIYDIHSPRIPSKEEIKAAISRMRERIPDSKLWVNPDCGLKTRGNAETVPSLKNLVNAAKEARNENC